MEQEIVFGEIESLAFGGQGILRHGGLVVFVPFVAPGDRVEVKITKRKKSFAQGELVSILSPGSERVSAPCPYFGQCGGCQLQHLSDEEQLRQKQRFVRDALRRIGKLPIPEEIPITPSTRTWGYRRHIRLTLCVNDDFYEAGYVRHDLAGVLPVTHCPIFLDSTDALLIQVQQLLQQLTPTPPFEGGHLSIIKSKPDSYEPFAKGSYVLAFQFPEKAPPNLDLAVRAWWQTQQNVAGFVVQSQEGVSSEGETEGSFDVNGLLIRFSPWAFVQCHPDQSLNVYEEILRLSRLCKARSVLDLYSGIGVTSLLLARENCHVIAVEGNPEAVQLAIRNAELNRIKGVEFLKADVARVLRGLLERVNPDLVILNPPRTGLDPQARQELLKARPKRLVYISCMPPTLARDLAALVEQGYELKSCRAYDMFPQTTHVETVALMERKD